MWRVVCAYACMMHARMGVYPGRNAHARKQTHSSSHTTHVRERTHARTHLHASTRKHEGIGAQVDERCARLITHLRDVAASSPSKAAVCVGHSHLFRRIFSKHFAKLAEAQARGYGGGGGGPGVERPEWHKSELGKMLQTTVLANCGVVALDLDQSGCIQEARLLFGSSFRAGHFDAAHDSSGEH